MEEKHKLTDAEIEEIVAKRHKETMEQYMAGYKRSRRWRWAFPRKAKVIHPLIGEVIVPAASKYAAVLCACEMCHVKFGQIHDAKVMAID